MKNSILLLAILLPFTALAGNGSGNVSAVVQLGGGQDGTKPAIAPNISVPLLDTSSFTLTCGTTAGSTNNVWPCYKDGVKYQVTAAKTARCESIRYRQGTSNSVFQFMTDSVTFGNDATVGSLTAPVYWGGSSTAYNMQGPDTANQSIVLQVVVQFPATRFVGIQIGGTSVQLVTLSCREI